VRSVFGSSVAASTFAVFLRSPDGCSSTAMSEPVGSGGSLKVTRTSVGDRVSRASEAGFDLT